MKESEIQSMIRDLLRWKSGEFWRINVGSGYLSHTWDDKPRWFSTGVPKGFPDLIGIIPRNITESDIGKIIGQFAFIEVKSDKGRASQDQKIFHELLYKNGAIGGIARDFDDVLKIFGDKNVSATT